jgi:hypothetical protein
MTAHAASTIVPNLLPVGIPANAGLINQNFGNAINDVNALQTQNAGVTPPSNPSIGNLWLQPGSPYIPPAQVITAAEIIAALGYTPVMGQTPTVVGDCADWVNTIGTVLGDAGHPCGGDVVGPSTSVVNDLALWGNTTGSLLSDPGPPFSVAGNVLQVPQLSTSPTITWSGSSNGGAALAGLWQQETLGGTSTAGANEQLSGNGIFAADNLIAPKPIYAMSLWDIEDNIGVSAQGNRNATKSFVQVLTTPSVKGAPGQASPGYVGIFPGGYLNVNLGGTAASIITAAGSLYGMNPNVTLGPNATNIFTVTGSEFDMTMLTGSSSANKFGMDVVQAAADAVQGSVNDAAFFAYNQIGAVGWKCGFCLGGVGSGGSFPLSSTGTILGTEGAGTTAKGVDFSSVTFSGNAWTSPGASIAYDGSGFFSNTTVAAHLLSTAVTPPVVSGCGSSPTIVYATDMSGFIKPGTGVATCTVTFQVVYGGSAPAVQLTPTGTYGALYNSNPQAASFTVTNNTGNWNGTQGFTYTVER